MESHYEINVARRVENRGLAMGRYVHLFATAPRSCVTEEDASRVAREITARFPAPEFHVSVTRQNCTGSQVDLASLLS